MTDSPPKTFIRTDGRQTWEPRPINIHPGFIENADGSVLVETGKTRVICTASVEEEFLLFSSGRINHQSMVG